MKIMLLTAALLLLAFLWEGIRMRLQIQKSSVLVRKSSPFERSVSDPSMRILVLGDSTAVGTGSADPKDSTAGRLGLMYPRAEVVNLAENGLKIGGLLEILAKKRPQGRFDIVLIQIGANDIIRQTPLRDIESGIEKVLAQAQEFGKTVIVLHSGNIGEAKFFPWYVRPLLSRRSLEVRNIYMEKAALYDARYVDLAGSSVEELLKEDPSRYYAMDHLHLSGEGYGLWFREIVKLLP